MQESTQEFGMAQKMEGSGTKNTAEIFGLTERPENTHAPTVVMCLKLKTSTEKAKTAFVLITVRAHIGEIVALITL